MIKFRREVRRRQRSAVRFFGDVGVILSRVRSRNPTLPVGSLVMIRKFYLRIRCLTLSTDSSSSFANLMPAPTSGRALLLTFSPVDSRFAPLIVCYSIARKSTPLTSRPVLLAGEYLPKRTCLFDVVGRCRQFVLDVRVRVVLHRLAIFQLRFQGINSVRIDNLK